MCARIAAAQLGLITRQQALDADMSAPAIGRRLVSGLWRRVLPAIYAFAGSPITRDQERLAVLLWAGERSVVSHLDAAAIWEIGDAESRGLEISTVRQIKTPRPDVIVHRVDPLDQIDVDKLGPLTITTPTRTLIDIAALLTAESLEWALDDALRKGLTRPARLEWHIRRLAAPGRTGIPLIRGLVGKRLPRGVPSPTRLERRLVSLIKRAGLPDPIREYPLILDGRKRYLDFAWPHVKLDIEGDSRLWHTSMASFEDDRARDAMLQALGWTVLRFTWRQIVDRPEWVVSQIKATWRTVA